MKKQIKPLLRRQEKMNELLKPTQVINQYLAPIRRVQSIMPEVPDYLLGIDQSGYRYTYPHEDIREDEYSSIKLVGQINIWITK